MENTKFKPFDNPREAQLEIGIKFPHIRDYKIESEIKLPSKIRFGKCCSIKMEKTTQKFVIYCDGIYFDKNGPIPENIFKKLCFD
jgi:hypothetical protein